MTSITLRKVLVATAAIAALSVAACGKKPEANNTTVTENTTVDNTTTMAPAADNAMSNASH